jgi:hypothetical protein
MVASGPDRRAGCGGHPADPPDWWFAAKKNIATAARTMTSKPSRPYLSRSSLLPDARAWRLQNSAAAAVALPIVFALGIIALLPLALVVVPPLVDYPNHLARMHILGMFDRSPALQAYYAVQWRPLPNLAMDAVVPLLARVMPLALAGKLFVALIFALLVGGTASVHRALTGRWSPWPCLSFLLLYNRLLLWGFLNFLFGTGLCLIAFAAWVALRERPLPLRLAVSSLLALLVYLSHLFAFGGYALLVAGYELGRLLGVGSPVRRGRGTAHRPVAAIGRTAAAASVQFIVPALLFLAESGGTAAGAAGPISYGNFFRKFDLFFTLFNDYSLPLDAASFGVLLAALAIGLWRRRIVIHPAMAVPLLVLLAAHFALPSTILTATAVDHRLPVLFGFVLIAGTDMAALAKKRERAGIPVRRVAAAAAVLVLFGLRMAAVASAWYRGDAAYADDLAALSRTVPAGGRLAVAYPPVMVNVFRDQPPLVHLPTMAVIQRDAFVPTLFAYPTQQPVALLPAYRTLADAVSPEALWSAFAAGPAEGGNGAATAALCRYDAAVFLDRRPVSVRSTGLLVPAESGTPTFRLYRVDRDACAAAADAAAASAAEAAHR